LELRITNFFLPFHVHGEEGDEPQWKNEQLKYCYIGFQQKVAEESLSVSGPGSARGGWNL
jgi:hypothetical protein